ncbi:MAG TPA: hypothetical protein VFH68_10870, partial [Polyangia bacterium]|nr:hypothetical protein [Polyangia bacterium]
MRTTFSFCATIASLLALGACGIHVTTPYDDPGAGGRPANTRGSDAGAGNQGYGGQTAGGETGNADDAGGGGGATAVPRLERPSRGSAVALSPDESLSLVVNRDVGSVT